MKSLEKNQPNPNTIAQHMNILAMQQKLGFECLKQGLRLNTTIGREQDAQRPYLQYHISFNSNEPVVFSGQAYDTDDAHFQAMLSLVSGKMVSEIFPPTIRTVQREPENDSNVPVEVPISYWKRRLVVEHDITMRDPDPKASRTDGLHKVSSNMVWVGYNTKGEEIVRVADGSPNKEPENVVRVQYMEMGQRGTVVVVIYKDTRRLREGEEGTLSEHFKTVIGASQDTEPPQGTMDETACSSGGFTVASPADVSLASRGTSTSTGSFTAPIDLSKILLDKKQPIDPNSELGKAVKRLPKITGGGSVTNDTGKAENPKTPARRKKVKIEIPKTIKVSALIKIVSEATEISLNAGTLVADAAKQCGIKVLRTGMTIDQSVAKSIIEKLGYQPVLLSEGGGAFVTTKPAAKKTVVKRSKK